jgi:cysteine synthase A
LELCHIEEELGLKARILAKIESVNPSGSIKDRAALSMILDAEEKGLIQPGATLIEPTSGNTGIGLASVAAAKGYKAIIVMPDTMSVERRRMIAAYGAEIVLTPGSLGMKGSIEKAEELQRSIPNSFIPGQFVNPANPAIHYQTTGPEIYRDTEGEVGFLVSAVGTGGTLSGAGKYLKEKVPGVQVIAVEPASSPLLTEGHAGPHAIQGIGANFVPDTLDTSLYDEVVDVADEDAFANAKLVGKKEGVLVGISSGAALTAAIALAKRSENAGKNIVVIFPDGGDRYFSTKLFQE